MQFPNPPTGARLAATAGAFVVSAAFVVGATWLLSELAPHSAVTTALGWGVYVLGVGMFFFIRFVALALLGY